MRAAGDVEVAIVVHPANVAGVQPAAAHRLARLLAAAQVAGHHAGPLGDDLSLLPGREDFAIGVHDHHDDIFHGPADGAQALQLALSLFGRAFRDLVVLGAEEGEG